MEIKLELVLEARETVWFLLFVCLLGSTYGQASTQVEYSLYEETPAGSYMGDIRQSADLSTKFAPDVYKTLRYAILIPSSEYAEYFTLDPVEGTMRTARPIDREKVCPQAVECTINFDVAIQPREHFQLIKVTVKLEDINDNAPTFIENHISRPMPENTQPGARFTLPAADDMDSPRLGVMRYELMTGAPQFALNVTKGADGSADLQLVLKEKLDREVRDLYTVVIVAYDGGISPKTGFLTVDMIVLDVNDNYPKFDNDTYEVTVPENVSQNSVIIKLRARDPDALNNGQVVYGFTSKTQAGFGSTFGINNITGEVYIKDKLDYETNKIYSLGVIAHDKTPEALTSKARVVIKVQDVNDHPPAITINALTTTGHVEISEGAPVDSFVAHIAVEDPDSGTNGELSCSIDSQFFDIRSLGGDTSTEYKVVTTKQLDRETGAFHQVIFICKDKGVPSLTSTATIPVTVLDENDHDPIFSKSVYSTIIGENNPKGETLLTIFAEDKDTGENAMVEYRFETDALPYLLIDAVSGNVSSKVSFDYEARKEYKYRVIATDHGVPPRSSTAILEITVRDKDDNPPSFLQDSYVFDVYENQPLGTEVGQVAATDADEEPFNSFMFFLDPGASATDTFVVEPQTGKIFTRQELDRETKSHYELVVMAVSQDAPSMQGSVKVTIYVADKNDNAPRVLFPNPRNDTVYVRSDTSLGTKVTQIIGDDFDIGINSRLIFQFKDGNESGYFVLDEQSGMIAVRKPLKDIEEKLFILKIQVMDSGEPQNKVEAFLNVVVNKSVDHTPILANQNLNIVISVAVITGILVIILIAAIIITKRTDTCGKPRKYVHKKILPPKGVKVKADKEGVINNISVDENNDTNSRKEAGFDIDMEDGKLPPSKYSTPPNNMETGLNNQMPSQYDPHASTYVSLYATKPQTHHPRNSNKGHGHCPMGQQELASTSFEREVKNINLAVNKDRDSDSTNSTASNADSGRGSNEDTDSRPSINDSNATAPDGVILVPPLQPQGHSDSFKVRLSSVVKMQHDHVADKLGQIPEHGCAPPLHPRKPSLKNKSIPNQNRQSRNSLPTRRPPQIPSKDISNSNNIGPTYSGPYNQASRNSRFSNMKNNQHHGYQEQKRYHDHRTATSEDDTETDFSDEDKEYVYYVNHSASHV